MPNLLSLELSVQDGSVQTKHLAAFLSRSPKIESIKLRGELLGDKQVLSPVIENLPCLKFITIYNIPLISPPGMGEEFLHGLHRFEEYQDQPLTVPISDKLNRLYLSSHYSASILTQKVAMNNIRCLNISGWLSVEFDFSFPKLVSFQFKFSKGLNTAWIIRRLQASPFLASFTFTRLMGLPVESACVDELKSLLETCKLLRFIDFSPDEVDHDTSSTETLTINLNCLACSPQAFKMVVRNRPIEIILPRLIQAENLFDDERLSFEMPEPGSREPSLFRFEGDMLHFSGLPGEVQPPLAKAE